MTDRLARFLLHAGQVEAATGTARNLAAERAARRALADVAEVLDHGKLIFSPRPPRDPPARRAGGVGLRVLHVLDSGIDPPGSSKNASSGYGVRSQAIINAQSAAGLDVHVVARRNGTPEPATDRDRIERLALQAVTAADSLGGIDIVHGHSDALFGLGGLLAARTLGVPFVYEVRGLWHMTKAALDPAFSESPLYTYRELLETQAVREADAVVTLSRPLADWCAAPRGGEAIIVPNGPSAAAVVAGARRAERPVTDGTPLTVVYAGALTGYEGIETLFEALALCRVTGVRFSTRIAGDGTERRPLMRLARRLGLGEDVAFLGVVSGDTLSAFYESADIGVLARRDLPVTRLVPPVKAADLMAAGVTPVLSDLPPLAEFGEEGVSRLSFPAGDAAALADHLLNLDRDRSRLRTFSNAAIAWYEANRAWPRLAACYGELYRHLVAAKS